MSAAERLSDPQVLKIFDPVSDLERRFHHWAEVTNGNAVAAAILATATVTPQAARRSSERTALTPPQVARQLGVDAATVIGWIRAGQLKASNVGKGGSRPRYRIQQKELDAFMKSREPQAAASTKRRSKQPAGDVVFFD